MAIPLIPFIFGTLGTIIFNKFNQRFSHSALEPKIYGSHIVSNCSIEPEFGFYRERSGIKKFLDYLGVFQEFTTSDPYFDSQVYLSCDTPAVSYVLKNSDRARQIISTLLFTKKIEKIEFHGGVLDIYVKGQKKELKDNLQFLMSKYDTDIQELASIFKREIDKRFVSDIKIQEDKSYNKKVKFILTSYLALTVGIVAEMFWDMLFSPNEHIVIGSYHYWPMIVLACILFLISGTLALWWASPSRKTHRVLYAHLTLGIALSVLGSIFIYNGLNTYLDKSASVSFDIQYSTYSRRGSKTTSYYLVIQNIKPYPSSSNSNSLESVGLSEPLQVGQTYSISSSRYRELDSVKDKKIILSTKKGFFNQPYIETI